MNSFSSNVYGADRVNQAVAVLGGATAQSYGAVGLNKPVLESEHFGAAQESVVALLTQDQALISPDSVSAMVKPFADSPGPVVALSPFANVVFDEQFESPVFTPSDSSQDSDLMSRFDAVETELSVGAGIVTPQNGAVGDVDSLADGISANANSSLLSFLEEVIAQAQASQEEFNGSLDGDNQGAIRELLGGIGSEARAGVRSSLLDNPVDALDIGVISLVNQVVEPVLTVSGNGGSTVPINETLDTIVQPIGSLSMPQVNFAMSNPQDRIPSSAF